MPDVRCRGHKKVAVDNFIALVIIEPRILLVGPTFGLFFEYGCHRANLTKSRHETNRKIPNS
ncbi:MAG: hypothetical protein ABI651_21465, partial [Verrucomicrobiota bacterium]